MLKLILLLAAICIPALAQSTKAADNPAAAIADRYLTDMQHKNYRFLSKEELSHRRDQVAAFAAKYLRQPLDQPTQTALLESIDHCLDRLYTQPARKIDYGNGFGSGGEEWMYLCDRDYFLTFQYYMGVALTNEKLSPTETKRREIQRDWMRKYLTDLPFRAADATPSAVLANQRARTDALAELEKDFADPMLLLSQPLSDEEFTELQKRFKEFGDGIWSDFRNMEIAALNARLAPHNDPAARYGISYTGKLPFEDTVVDLWANGPSLHFASNADFRGNYGMLSADTVYDVTRCASLFTKPAPAANSPAMNDWLNKEARGDLTLDGDNLIAVRGAKIFELYHVKDWFEADVYTDKKLHDLIRAEGVDQISIKRLPTGNGIHNHNRTEGEFFIAVQTRDNRLAVINLYEYEFSSVACWCRPRPAPTEKAK